MNERQIDDATVATVGKPDEQLRLPAKLGRAVEMDEGDEVVLFVADDGHLEVHVVPDEIEPDRAYPAPVFTRALRRFIERNKA